MWVPASRKLDITEYASLDGSERWSCWNSFYTETPEQTPTALTLYGIVSTALSRSRWLSTESDSTCVFFCNFLCEKQLSQTEEQYARSSFTELCQSRVKTLQKLWTPALSTV